MSALEVLREELIRLARAPSTVAQTTAVARRLMAWLGALPLERVAQADLERYLADRAGVLSRASLGIERRCLRTFFRVLVNAGVLPETPAQGLPPIKCRRRVGRALAEEDVARLLAAASVPRPRSGGLSEDVVRALALRDRALVELLYGAGVRAGEAIAARVTDLDLAGGNLLVRALKRNPPRHLPLPPACLPHLARYLRESRSLLAAGGGSPCLLLTRRGGPLQTQLVYKIVRSLAKRIGLQAHPHMLRRSLATHLTRSGASLSAVQSLLGHANLATTTVYLALDVDDLRAAVETLDLGGS